MWGYIDKMKYRIFVFALLQLAIWIPPVSAQTENRYAVLVGSHRGQAGEHPLRYAGRDARKLAEVLIHHGKFNPSKVITLEDPSADAMRNSLIRLNARIRSESCPGCRSVLLVYYSGHADALSVHLGPSSLLWEELRDLTKGSSADLRILIVDACRSGQATQVKGFKASEAFALPPESPLAEGYIVLSSSAAGEAAQESDELQGSFFTHHFLSALRGAADFDADGRVTLAEAYRYTLDRTIASTATTLTGIQHPTFNFEMRGKAQLVLSYADGNSEQAELTLTKPGVYLFHRGKGPDSPVEMEAHVPETSRTVWLAPGDYFVRWRTPENLKEGLVVLSAAHAQILKTEELHQVEYTALVRKGILRRQGWEGDEIPAFNNAYPLRDGEGQVGFLRPTGIGVGNQLQFSTSLAANAFGFLNLDVMWNFVRTSHFAAAIEMAGGYGFFQKSYAAVGRMLFTTNIGHRLYLSAIIDYGISTLGPSDFKEKGNAEKLLALFLFPNGFTVEGEIELILNPCNLFVWSLGSGYNFDGDSLVPLKAYFGYAHRFESFRFLLGVVYSMEDWDWGEKETPIIPMLDFWWRW